MSKFFFNEMVLPAGIIALLLIACGDSATAPAGGNSADGNVADFGPVDNLPSCTENCEGNQAFQPDPCENFQCADNQWKPVEEWSNTPVSSATQSYSPSEMPTSGSSVESSSSFVKSSSSNSAKSSSSSVRFSSSSVAKSSGSSVKSSSSQGSSACSSLFEDGTLTDCRDGQTYKTVTIGSQVWMAENLNYETASSYCPYGEALYCTNGYGRLYTWAAAMDSAGTWGTNGKGCGCSKKICRPINPVQGVCPSGWHLPTSTEWETLFTAVGGDRKAITVLRSQKGWAVPIALYGTDDYGFAALPAGYRHSNGNFYGDYASARFWSATEDFSDDDVARYMDLYYSNERAFLGYSREDFAYSVRCLQD